MFQIIYSLVEGQDMLTGPCAQSDKQDTSATKLFWLKKKNSTEILKFVFQHRNNKSIMNLLRPQEGDLCGGTQNINIYVLHFDT